MALHQSGEDYLEAILQLRQKRGAVRSIDVAQELGFSKPSVSRAMSILKADGHITMEVDGHILLTESGEQIATEILDRHLMLTRWLIDLGVDETTAQEDACKIEHQLSKETYDCLRRHINQNH